MQMVGFPHPRKQFGMFGGLIGTPNWLMVEKRIKSQILSPKSIKINPLFLLYWFIIILYQNRPSPSTPALWFTKASLCPVESALEPACLERFTPYCGQPNHIPFEDGLYHLYHPWKWWFWGWFIIFYYWVCRISRISRHWILSFAMECHGSPSEQETCKRACLPLAPEHISLKKHKMT